MVGGEVVSEENTLDIWQLKWENGRHGRRICRLFSDIEKWKCRT